MGSGVRVRGERLASHQFSTCGKTGRGRCSSIRRGRRGGRGRAQEDCHRAGTWCSAAWAALGEEEITISTSHHTLSLLPHPTPPPTPPSPLTSEAKESDIDVVEEAGRPEGIGEEAADKVVAREHWGRERSNRWGVRSDTHQSAYGARPASGSGRQRAGEGTGRSDGRQSSRPTPLQLVEGPASSGRGDPPS